METGNLGVNNWDDLFKQVESGGTSWNVYHASPIISDIEFSEDGGMIIGMLDRVAHQIGSTEPVPVASGTSVTPNLAFKYSAGDILKACLVDGSFVLEGGTGCPVNDQNPNNTLLLNTDGPSGAGEFFFDDFYGFSASEGHGEIVLGGIAIKKGTNEVVSSTIDPLILSSQGLEVYHTINGTNEASFEIVPFEAGDFAKAAGLGDVELLCESPPLEIGNYVWEDTNQDGIQDAGEPGIAGVTVQLYSNTGVLEATTTTDTDGQYYFSHSDVTTQTWANAPDSVEANTNYYIVVGSGQFTMNELTVSGNRYVLTPDSLGSSSNRFAIDSDAEVVTSSPANAFDNLPATLITTGNWGCIDHSFDFGFSLCPILAAVASDPTSCGGTDGTITLTLTNVPDGTYTINYMDGTPSAQTFTNVSVSGGSATISGLSAGVYNDLTITSNGCISTEDVDLSLSDPAIPSLAASSSNPTTCSGTDGSITLTLTNVPDGTYTINYMDGAPSAQTFTNVSVSGGSATINGLGAGVYNDLTITSTNCTSTEDVDITLNDPSLPTVGLNDPSDECVDGTDMSFTGTPTDANGSFSTTAGAGFTDNGDGTATLDVSAAGAGSYDVTYTYTDGSGCTNSETVSVTINALPTVSLNDPADVCIDGADMNFTGTPTNANGSFSTTAGAGLTDNGNGTATLDVSAAGAGTYDVTYTYTDGNGCTNSTTVSVTINGLPTVGLNDPADVCIDDSDMNFTGTPTDANGSV